MTEIKYPKLEQITNDVIKRLKRTIGQLYFGSSLEESLVSLVPLGKDAVTCFRDGTPLNEEDPGSAYHIRGGRYGNVATLTQDTKDPCMIQCILFRPCQISNDWV
jgi:hypothetical protein